MENNQPILPENNPDPGSAEDLKLENEILRLKLKAQTGGELHHASGELPPEVENIFLNHILAFEDRCASAGLIKIRDFIGNPLYRPAGELGPEQIEAALKALLKLMFSRQLTVDFGTLTNPEKKYRFITEELLEHEISNVKVPGMFLHFMYEEFYPDHEADVRKRSMEFITDWFDRSMGKFSWELAEEFIMEDGSLRTKEKVISMFQELFKNYKAFENCHYLFKRLHVELKEKDTEGLAVVDGSVKFTALLQDGESIQIEGPFKLFLSMQYNCWRIYYFIFPGFKW